MQSVTFVIAKTGKNHTFQAYQRRMKTLLDQTKNPQYGDSQTVSKIAFIMEYFSVHHEQIYLFTAA